MSIGDALDDTTQRVLDATDVDEVVVRLVDARGTRAIARHFGHELDTMLGAFGDDFATRARHELANLRGDNGEHVAFAPLERGKRFVITVLERPPFFTIEQRIATPFHRFGHELD